MSVINNRSYSRFWPVAWTITQFWGPEVISRLTNPVVQLLVGHQHSQFGAFMEYYSLLLGPVVISTINEPRGAFTSPSSTLTVLANSDLFHGL